MKNSVIKLAIFSTVVLLLLAANVEPAVAQCAMCKAASEANLKAGGGDPQGLNAGILYMLVLPYLLVGGVGFWWWHNRRRRNDPLDDDFEERVLNEN